MQPFFIASGYCYKDMIMNSGIGLKVIFLCVVVLWIVGGLKTYFK